MDSQIRVNMGSQACVNNRVRVNSSMLWPSTTEASLL